MAVLNANARLAMSVTAVIGALITLFTLQPVPLTIAAVIVWGAVVVISVVRGSYSFATGFTR